MSYNNSWLYQQLSKVKGIEISPEYRPLIIVKKDGRIFKIYTPTPHEYLITIDIVEKVKELGGNVISFPLSWCRASREAVAFGKVNGVDVIPHGRLFEMLQA